MIPLPVQTPPAREVKPSPAPPEARSRPERPLLEYRPDIDGLRAVAIALVVAFHAAPRWARGGFVGVDSFFVISGFLITRILLADRSPGRLRRFYGHRVRRLFPALLVVLAACLLVAPALLQPDALQRFYRNALAAILFVGNIRRWLNAGYFDTSAIQKPLLHLWSLGIEEQFYLVWPLLLGWLARSRRRALAVTLALAAASLVADLVVVRSSPSTAFFLPFFRGWELLVGAALAQVDTSAVFPARGALRNGAALAGAGALLGSAWWIDPRSAFPSWSALAPVLGTALLLWAGKETVLARRVLSHRAMVGVGLISYPLYLWHWPLISFLVLAKPAPAPAEMAALVLLAVLLAAGTYFLVEKPARAAYRRAPRRTVAALCVSAGLLAVAVAVAVRAPPRGPREPPQLAFFEAQRSLDFESRARIPTRPCVEGGPLADTLRPFCKSSPAPLGAPTWLLLGDSTAEAWAPLVQTLAAENGARAVVVSISGCPPLLGVRGPARPGCALDDDAWKLALVERLHPSRIVLTARWGAYVEEPPSSRPEPAHFVTTEPGGEADLASSRLALQRRLIPTLERLAAIAPVVVLASLPDLYFDPSRAFWYHIEYRPTRAQHEARQRRARDLLDEATARLPGVTLVDPAPRLCASGTCEAMLDGRMVYRDDSHVTAQGSLLYRDELAAALHLPPRR